MHTKKCPFSGSQFKTLEHSNTRTLEHSKGDPCSACDLLPKSQIWTDHHCFAQDDNQADRRITGGRDDNQKAGGRSCILYGCGVWEKNKKLSELDVQNGNKSDRSKPSETL